jgi:hypothetical protein
VAMGIVENAVLCDVVLEPDPLPPPLEHAASNARPAPATTSGRTIARKGWPFIRGAAYGAERPRSGHTAPAPQGGAVPSEYRMS